MADVATVLFQEFLKFDPSDPRWPDRDRFIISNGHGSMLLYSLMYLTGYNAVPVTELKRFRCLGSRTPGHPEYNVDAGVETTTGPLGQGVANAVGMALAERILAAAFGTDLVDHFTYVMLGDGCLMEGISHEAMSLAGHLKLGRLIALFDQNEISIDGTTGLAVSDDVPRRGRALGWHVMEVDGHEPSEVRAAIQRAKDTPAQPSLICCRTTIGLGLGDTAGTHLAHSDIPDDRQSAEMRKRLGCDGWAPFEIPNDLLSRWREIGARGLNARIDWERRLAVAPSTIRSEFERRLQGELPENWRDAIRLALDDCAVQGPIPTRACSGAVLGRLAESIPELLGGAADVTRSTYAKVAGQAAIRPGDYHGSFIHYGVREHGMAAVMNGLAVHQGLIPYGATYLAFSDYMRPAIRLAAMMNSRVTFVMTHDSIGVGENGPTHQPVEQLAALRSVPGLRVFRPADAIETAECWEIILEARAPSVLALSCQPVPALRRDVSRVNRSARGGYVLLEAEHSPRRLTIIGTGSELHIAVAARDILEREGIPTAVVSMPCWLLFDKQSELYRKTVLGDAIPRIAIEAGVSLGWERYLGPNGVFIGMHGFGASGEASKLYNHFGISIGALLDAARAILSATVERTGRGIEASQT